jgi:hypothetical protein
MPVLIVLVEMATILTTLYGTFTELWKKRQANIEKSRMRQLLISNASHEGTYSFPSTRH